MNEELLGITMDEEKFTVQLTKKQHEDLLLWLQFICDKDNEDLDSGTFADMIDELMEKTNSTDPDGSLKQLLEQLQSLKKVVS